MPEGHLKNCSTPCHQVNVNQNKLEIPPHKGQKDKDQKSQVTTEDHKDVEKMNIPTLLVSLQGCTTILEISLAIPLKVGHSAT